MSRLKQITGMTLIEILAGLIIVSILALVVLRYLGVSINAGGDALDDMRHSDAVASVMERITVDYTRRIAAGENILSGLKTAVGGGGTRQANGFGTYEVIVNSYIDFDGAGQEMAATDLQNVLKVKIRVENRSLLALFTE